MKPLQLLTVVILFLRSLVSYCQAPDLGAVSNFALFTAVGALNFTGTSNITGNIRTNAGVFTGSPTLIGQIHIEDSVSAQAAIAVNAAYTYLNEKVCDSVLADTLGNNQILTPHIYCIGAAATLNGTLMLDAHGDSNALFIFKINGALNTMISSQVILINSACSCNVFWLLNGALNLDTNSAFDGNAIANGAINLLDGSSLTGRGLSINGAISSQNNLVVLTAPSSANPLPIELLSFNAYTKNMNVQINWSTASEINNNYFTIQRTENGSDFEDILRVKGAGNSVTVLYYSAFDIYPYEGISYYRLMQTDFDGKFTYSNLVMVTYENNLSCTIYPNPFVKSTTLVLNEASDINIAELRIYTIAGAEVMNTILTKQSTVIETDNFTSGIYFYEIICNNKTTQSGRLISQ